MQFKEYIACTLMLMASYYSAPACFADEAPDAPAEEVSAGPLLEARKQLMAEIKKAKAQGVGIGGYMTAFQGIEEQIKTGAPEDQVTPRIDSIRKSLAEQLKRSQLLKIQKPAPPQGSQITGSGSPSASGPPVATGGGGGGGGGGDGVLAKLKQKFGGNLDNIPEDQIPAQYRDKLKDPAIRQKLLDKLGGGN